MKFKPTTQKTVYKIKHCIQHTPDERQTNLILRSEVAVGELQRFLSVRAGKCTEDTGNA